MSRKKKRCTKCAATKPVSDFHKQSSSSDGLQSHCSPCQNEQSKERYEQNKDREVTSTEKQCLTCSLVKTADEFYRSPRHSDGLRNSCKSCTSFAALANRYNISVEGFIAKLADQNGRCGVCLERFLEGQKIIVDHDHTCCPGNRSCGECIRGLTHLGCNTGLGQLGDSLEGLIRALAYLQNYNARRSSR